MIILYLLFYIVVILISKKITENIIEARTEKRRSTGKLTDDEINRMMAQINANLIGEGVNPSKELDDITLQYLKGKITSSEAAKSVVRIKMRDDHSKYLE
jgi:energy-converting hydrogenase Eha subunit H